MDGALGGEDAGWRDGDVTGVACVGFDAVDGGRHAWVGDDAHVALKFARVEPDGAQFRDELALRRLDDLEILSKRP